MPAENVSIELTMKIIAIIIILGVAITLVLFFVPQTPEWLASALKTFEDTLGIFGA